MKILQWLVIVFTVFGLTSGNAISAQCGKRIVTTGFIAKGVEVKRNYWPWLAALISREDGQFFCGATLISLKTVITAAHCMQDKRVKERLNPSDFEVHLGRHDLSDNEELEDDAKVLEPIIIIAMHPDWNPKSIRYDADIALLIAANYIKRSLFIQPICLQKRDIPNTIGTIVGWGFSSDGKRETEDIARQAAGEKVPLVDCLLEEGDLSLIASKRTYCIKGVTEGSGPCRGDSGGGFFTNVGDIWFIDGIVSSGLVRPMSNCLSTKHSLFTKLSSFKNWIERGIKEFYEVQFSNILINLTGDHKLNIPHILRRGAFLSTIGHSVDFGAKQVVCEDQDWGYLPNNIGYMFPNLKQLYALRLKIKSIERLNFKNMERLEELDLSNNLIEEIPSNCFDDLKKLVKIYISYNNLRRIHADTFMHNPSLNFIDLNWNQIQQNEIKNLRNANFEILWLQENQLESIPFDAFHGMTNLKWIYLSGNMLTTLHQDTFLKNLNLTGFWAADNQIRNLPEGLFRNNNKMDKLDFKNNKITEINTMFRFQSGLPYEFSGNICINKDFYALNPTDLTAMNEEIQRQCGRE